MKYHSICPEISNTGLYPGLISDVEFAINDDGLVQVRSALRSMAPDASACSTWSGDGSWLVVARGESSRESSKKMAQIVSKIWFRNSFGNLEVDFLITPHKNEHAP